jgi:hypothetical protein
MATTSICKDFVATNKKTYTDMLKAVNTSRKTRNSVKVSQEVKRGAELLAQFSFR